MGARRGLNIFGDACVIHVPTFMLSVLCNTSNITERGRYNIVQLGIEEKVRERKKEKESEMKERREPN